MSEQSMNAFQQAIDVATRHVDRARKAVSECPDWSPAQAEWSRARDLGLDILEELQALRDAAGSQ